MTFYLIANAMLQAAKVILGIFLIRLSPRIYSLTTISLGGILTDLLSRLLLQQPLLCIPTLTLLLLCVFLIPRNSLFPTRPVPPRSKFFLGIIYSALLLHILIFTIYFLSLSPHQPIASLIDLASQTHHSRAAEPPFTLAAAVREYHSRYGRPPPPGFDLWFRFAMDRRARVLHEYDQIVEDLRPYWGIQPEELRKRVSFVASNEWNNLALVKVRNHRAEIAIAPQWKVTRDAFATADYSGCRKRWSR
jgi:hypothetical protein